MTVERYDVTHTICKQVAFRLKVKPYWGMMLSSSQAVMPDGSQPEHGAPMHCGSCGDLLHIPQDIYSPHVIKPPNAAQELAALLPKPAGL